MDKNQKRISVKYENSKVLKNPMSNWNPKTLGENPRSGSTDWPVRPTAWWGLTLRAGARINYIRHESGDTYLRRRSSGKMDTTAWECKSTSGVREIQCLCGIVPPPILLLKGRICCGYQRLATASGKN